MKPKEPSGARSERRIRQFGSIAASRVADRRNLAAKQGREYIPQAQRCASGKSKEERREERRQAVRDAKAAYRFWREQPHVKAWLDTRSKEKSKAKYQVNKERERLKFKKRYYQNLQSERLRSNLYKHSNPNKAVKHGNKRKELAAIYADGSATHDEVGRLFGSARQCPYCGADLLPATKSLDHVVPLSRGGPHSIFNLLVCCVGCNSRKRAKSFDEWLNQLDEPFRTRCERMYRRRFNASPKQAVMPLPFSQNI